MASDAPGPPARLALFAAAVFVSAALLFAVQPMFARMVLPLMGGTPATWTTCLLFFQGALLLGYLYVHLATRRLAVRAQAIAHVLLLAVVVVLFPLTAPPAALPSGEAPAAWLLVTLARCVGLPFVAAAATAPLLQRWYAGVSGRDPYFLYAASNLGSLVGLLGYPLLIEPMLTLPDQRALWSAAFAVLALLIAACAAVTSPARQDVREATPQPAPAITVRIADRLWWVLLALVPSSLLMGVTAHISTDVAAVPLLWVVPLALYLLTFIDAFAVRPLVPRRWSARLAPVAIVAALGGLVAGPRWPIGLALHLAAFAVLALAFHRELAERRPDAAHLTGYFLLVATGGALGGVFNALVAPQVFTQISEYPVMLALAAVLRPPAGWRDARPEPLALVAGVPIVVSAVVTAVLATGLVPGASVVATTLAFWLVVAVALVVSNRRAGFALAVAIAAAAHLALPRLNDGRIIYAARSFFGVHRVIENDARTMHRLLHGTTLHGVERLHDSGCEPTSYYHPDSPIGQLFGEGRLGAGRVAVVGLGAGGLSCYAPRGSRWTFLEIDPLVERIARTPSLFTYLARTPGTIDVLIGDGRIRLAGIDEGSLDAVIADAFSSDAIPVHLMTREFMALALARVKPGGLVVFHISNRYLDLGPVLGAAAASLGAQALERRYQPTHTDAVASRWLVVGRAGESLAALAADPRWRPPSPGARMWTDDFSNILDVMAWTPAAAAARIAQ